MWRMSFKIVTGFFEGVNKRGPSPDHNTCEKLAKSSKTALVRAVFVLGGHPHSDYAKALLLSLTNDRTGAGEVKVFIIDNWYASNEIPSIAQPAWMHYVNKSITTMTKHDILELINYNAHSSICIINDLKFLLSSSIKSLLIL